jgi:hypothetical protein
MYQFQHVRIMMVFLYSSTMQNTEGGRKLNQAMVSTGRAVATTGRAVGEHFCSVCEDYAYSETF